MISASLLPLLDLSIVMADHHLCASFGKSRIKPTQSRPLWHAFAPILRQLPVLVAVGRINYLLGQTLVEHLLVHGFDGPLPLAEHTIQLLLS